MYKVFKLSMFVLVFSVTIFIQSCSEDAIFKNENTPTLYRSDGSGVGYDGNPNIWDFEYRFITNNPYRNQLTEIISIACCRQPKLKKAIKSSIEEFKLNYNLNEDELFFNIVKDLPNSELGGNSIKQVLIEIVPEKPVNEVIDFLCKNDPGLAILMEGNLTSSSISDDIYIDENFDDSNLDSPIYAYGCGMRKEKKLREAEFNPEMIFIVRESEAYSPETPLNNDYIEAQSLGIICENDVIVIANTINGNSNNPNPNGGGDPGEGEGQLTPDCPDNWRFSQNGKENLLKYKTSKDYDPGRGKGEFLQYALWGTNVKYQFNQSTGKLDITGYVTNFVEKRQDKVKDDFKWRIVNADLFRWYPEDSGYSYKIIWYEDDGGKLQSPVKKVKLTVKTNVGGLPIEGTVEADVNLIPKWLSDGDDFIGENIIDFCDDYLYDYTPNALDQTVFNVNER